jgi:hypothetical protein
MTNKLTVREARAALASQDESRKRAVLEELEAIGAGEITDVLAWDNLGRVTFKGSEELDARTRKAIKKVKVTPGQYGSSIEVEMHDKLSALRLLSKHHGLLEQNADMNRPSLIGINLKGPEVTTYEVIDDDE